MPQIAQIDNQWIEELFENDLFRLKLNRFLAQPAISSQRASDEKLSGEINAACEEVSSMIVETITRQSQSKFSIVAEQISKIGAQIANLKNAVFGCNQKIDLETTYHNKSKLQLSSILQHDMAYDLSEVRSSLSEIHQRFNQWFDGKFAADPLPTADNFSQSKISLLINKKCAEHVQLLDKKILKRFEATDLLTERRFEQVSKTMNNVLQMLNEAHNKKTDRIQASQMDTVRQSAPSQPSLMRQSSLQNLKIKSFFNFGHK